MIANKSCIVFGANGYLGRHMVSFLNNTGFSVVASDIQDSYVGDDANYIRANILNPEDLNLFDWSVDFIFMFAGITGTRDGFERYEQYIQINEIGLLNILTKIRSSKSRPRIIFPSTRLVYKGTNNSIREQDEKETKTIYAINKLSCERLLDAYSQLFKIPYTVYRICVPYDNHFKTDYSYGTIGFFLDQAKNNSKINLFGDGLHRRTFTSIEDICMQIILSCQHDKSVNQVYNTIGEDYSLKEIARLISKKYNAEISYTEWPEEALIIESGSTVFNYEKFETEFHYCLINTFESWLDRL